MKTPPEFDDIRCYNDDEVKSVIPQILSQPQVGAIVKAVLGDDLGEYLLRTLAPMETVNDFQRDVIVVLLAAVEHKTCHSVTLYGTENIDKDRGHLYISNHRDIVMDSALLNEHLFFKGFETTQIGIGNNLLVNPWIEKLVRVNKSFIVKRDGGMKEQLQISRQLSEYIRFVICQNGKSVWLAQREGRAKDSDDRTQSSVIKMLEMSAKGSISQGINELAVLPVSINYEYDPCDYLKAKELQQKRDDKAFAKSPADDVLSMRTGILGPKGRVSFVISPRFECPEIVDNLPRNQAVAYITEALDKAIHAGYVLYPNNYIAADLLTGERSRADKYTAEEAAKFQAYLKSRIKLIDLEHKDETFLMTELLKMYGNPVVNKELGARG